MKFRKLFLSAVATVAVFGLAACGGTSGTAKKPVFETKEDVYGMGAVTTVALLESEFASPAMQRLAAAVAAADAASDPAAPVEPDAGETGETPVPEQPGEGGTQNPETPGETTPANPIEGQLEQFHQYFNMLDALMGENIATTVTDNTDEAYAQYAFRMEIAGADLGGNPVTHVMYYNETGSTTETEEDETETETTLAGVMLMNGVEYVMEGEQSAESEAGEAESGIAIRAYLDAANRDDYVEVKQETETETGETETEYVYRVYQGGVCIEETAVEFESETEDNENETEISLEFRNAGGAGLYTLDKEVKDGKTVMRVTYDTVVAGEKTQGAFYVTEETDAEGNSFYRYEFDNGWSEDLDKDDD